jgi:ABC-type branched-subunit amino acid transport system ATPase component
VCSPSRPALENLLGGDHERVFKPARKRAEELLRFVKLETLADEYAGKLSYGQQKLLEFIRSAHETIPTSSCSTSRRRA